MMAMNAKTSTKQVEFDQLREETWDLLFIEKHYRSIVKQLKEEGLVEVRFLPPKQGGST